MKLTDNTGKGMLKNFSNLIADDHAQAVDAIAHAIAFQEPQVIALLNKYGIAVSAKPTHKELLDGLMLGFSKNKNMPSDFTGMVLGKKAHFSNFGPGDCAPPFDEEGHPLNCDGTISGGASDTNAASPCSWWAKTFGKCGEAYTPATSGGATESGTSFGSILSGIVNIVGLFGKPSTAAQANQTQAQIAAAAAAKAAAAKTTTTIWIVVGFIVVAVIGIAVAIHMNKKKGLATAATA